MKLTKILALSLAVFGLASCNTISGVGRDFQQFGGGISSKAQGGTYKDGATSTTIAP